MEHIIDMVRGKSLLLLLTIFLILQMVGIVNVGLIFPFIVGKEAGLLAIFVFMLTSSLTRFDLSRFASKDIVKDLQNEVSTLKIDSEICKAERQSLRMDFIELAKTHGVLDNKFRELVLHSRQLSEELQKKETELHILTRHK